MQFEKLYGTIINEHLFNELEDGVRIEKEHTDLLNFFKKFCAKHKLSMPIDDDGFFAMIAKAHLREFPNYYTALMKMEDELKNAKQV